MLTIPDAYRDLFEKPVYAVLTTIMPDGQPQSTVVWVDYNGEQVRINTARGRQKDKNLARDPRVSVLLMDPQDPYRWVEIRGRVDLGTEAGAVDHIESLSWKYKGQKYYGGFSKRNPADETRVTYRITPTRVLIYPHPK
jgi:PPOX class probable F420-dependent enzyme